MRTLTTTLGLALCLGGTAIAQDVMSAKEARKELVQTIREQTIDHRDVMKDAYSTLKDDLKQIENDAKDGELTSTDIARSVHESLVDYVGLMKTVTAFVASEISGDAGAILDELGAVEYPDAFAPGAGRDLDKGLDKLEKANLKLAQRAERSVGRLIKKLDKLGFALTIRIVDDIPVGIAPNPTFSYTSLNFDTLIDVVVACSRIDALSDATLVVGGISNPAKGTEVSVQINGVGGIEFTTSTTIVGDRWDVEFDSSVTPIPEGNYRIIANHSSTRVGTTLGVR